MFSVLVIVDFTVLGTHPDIPDSGLYSHFLLLWILSILLAVYPNLTHPLNSISRSTTTIKTQTIPANKSIEFSSLCSIFFVFIIFYICKSHSQHLCLPKRNKLKTKNESYFFGISHSILRNTDWTSYSCSVSTCCYLPG